MTIDKSATLFGSQAFKYRKLVVQWDPTETGETLAWQRAEAWKADGFKEGDVSANFAKKENLIRKAYDEYYPEGKESFEEAYKNTLEKAMKEVSVDHFSTLRTSKNRPGEPFEKVTLEQGEPLAPIEELETSSRPYPGLSRACTIFEKLVKAATAK